MQFEQIVLCSLTYRREFASKVINFLKPEYFSDIGQRQAFLLINDFYNKYKAPPSKDSLLINLSNTTLPEAVYEPTATAINALYDDSENNSEWMFIETEKWAQQRAIYLAMVESLQIVDGKDKKKSKESIIPLLQEALAVRFDNSIGHDYLEDGKAQWDWYQNPAAKIPYLIEIMNKITKGGNTRKTLSVVQAGINVGKTTWLLNMAAGYAKQGLNGIYFTLEIGEEELRERLDVHLFGETSETIRAHDVDPYLNRVRKQKDDGMGDIIVKRFAASTVNVGHLRNVCREYELLYKKKIDFIIVDYITLLNSASLPLSMKADSNYYYTNVAEELRALFIEFNSIGWTAQQFNRGGQDGKDPKLSDSGLSIGVQATSDFTVALVSPNELKLQNKAVGTILKNRFANKAKISKFMIGLDDDLQKFFDMAEGEEYKDVNDKLQEEIDRAMELVDANLANKDKPKKMDFSVINFGAPSKS